MWPREEGERRQVHRLTFSQAVLLLRAIARDGRFSSEARADALYDTLRRRETIDADFPVANSAARLAYIAVEEERLRIEAGAGERFRQRQAETRRILEAYVANPMN